MGAAVSREDRLVGHSAVKLCVCCTSLQTRRVVCCTGVQTSSVLLRRHKLVQTAGLHQLCSRGVCCAALHCLQVQIYDLASDSWSLGKDLPYSVGSAATTLIGPYVYLCGGILQATGKGRGSQWQACMSGRGAECRTASRRLLSALVGGACCSLAVGPASTGRALTLTLLSRP